MRSQGKSRWRGGVTTSTGLKSLRSGRGTGEAGWEKGYIMNGKGRGGQIKSYAGSMWKEYPRVVDGTDSLLLEGGEQRTLENAIDDQKRAGAQLHCNIHMEGFSGGERQGGGGGGGGGFVGGGGGGLGFVVGGGGGGGHSKLNTKKDWGRKDRKLTTTGKVRTVKKNLSTGVKGGSTDIQPRKTSLEFRARKTHHVEKNRVFYKKKRTRNREGSQLHPESQLRSVQVKLASYREWDKKEGKVNREMRSVSNTGCEKSLYNDKENTIKKKCSKKSEDGGTRLFKHIIWGGFPPLVALKGGQNGRKPGVKTLSQRS